jgi:hypothetical protein
MKYSYSFSHESLNCEICSEKYPDYIKYNNRLYNIKYNIPFKHYFLFNINIWTLQTSFVYNLDYFLKQKFITIGLSNKCDITITDIFLSDLQSVFILKKDGIYLEDYMSKYGTYIKINNENINLNLNKIIFVIDRIYFSCKIKKSFFNFGCCDLINSSLIPQSYSSQNKREFKFEETFYVKEIKEEEDNFVESNRKSTEKLIKEDNSNKSNNNYKNTKINNLIKSHNTPNEFNNNNLFRLNLATTRSIQSQINNRYNQNNDNFNENIFKIEDI